MKEDFQTYLLRIDTYGFKNIKDKITLSFCNDTITKPISKTKLKVKAIYGANGSGKTAIIKSIELYRNILADCYYLVQDDTIEMIDNYLNKEVKQFYFKIYIALVDGNEQAIYSHELVVRQDGCYPRVEHEKMCLLSGQTLNTAKEETVFETVNDVLVCKNEQLFEKALIEKTKNTLCCRSVLAALTDKNINGYINDTIKQEQNSDKTLPKFSTLKALYVLALEVDKIIVYLDEDDYLLKLQSSTLNNLLPSYLRIGNNGESKVYLSDKCDYVHNLDIDEYIENLHKMEEFIRIFKPNLASIDLEKKIDKDYFHCEKVLNYSSYKLSSEFESKGIKKLMRLYNFLEEAVNGKTVFLDELDANLSAIYLEKLLKYFIQYGLGELYFTSHNTEPMKILTKMKKAIDFVGETGKIVSWIKNGNYAPDNQYREGMIEDCPFNISEYDFMRAFSKKKQ